MATVTEQLADNPFFLEAQSGDDEINYDAEDFRRLLGGIWPRTGILTPTSFQITQANVVGWSVQVAAGYCVVGNTISETSRYLVHNPAARLVNVDTFNRFPVTTRTHKVWLGVYDKLLSSNEYAAKIIVTEDEGAGAPAPSLPAYYIQLGSFTISNGQANIQNAQITNSVRHAAMGPSPIDLTITANIVDARPALGTANPSAVYANGTVKLQGGFARSSNNDFDAGGSYILATLPASLRPSTTKYLIGAGSVNHAGTNAYAGFYYRVTITTTGSIQADIPPGYAPQYLMIDGLQFEVD